MAWKPFPLPSFVWPKKTQSADQSGSRHKARDGTKSSDPSKKSSKTEEDAADSDMSLSDASDDSPGSSYKLPISETLVYHPRKKDPRPKGSNQDGFPFLGKGHDDNRESPPEKKRKGIIMFDSGNQDKGIASKNYLKGHSKSGQPKKDDKATKRPELSTEKQIDKMISSIRQESEGSSKAQESKRGQQGTNQGSRRKTQRSHGSTLGTISDKQPYQDRPASSQGSFDANRGQAGSSIRPNRGIHPSLFWLSRETEDPPWARSSPHVPEPVHQSAPEPVRKSALGLLQSSYDMEEPDENESALGPMSHAPTPMSHTTTPISHATPPWSHATTPISHATPPWSNASHATTPWSNATTPVSHATTPWSQATIPTSHAPTLVDPITSVTQPSVPNPSAFQALSTLLPTSSSAFQALSSLLPSGIQCPGLPPPSEQPMTKEVTAHSEPNIIPQPGIISEQGPSLPESANIQVQKEALTPDIISVPQTVPPPESVSQTAVGLGQPSEQQPASTDTKTTAWPWTQQPQGAGWPRRSYPVASQPDILAAAQSDIPAAEPLGDFSDITDAMILVRLDVQYKPFDNYLEQ